MTILFGNTDKMYIHFAETRRSNKCSLYNCLYQAKARSGLLSYHYRDGEKYFAIWWDGLVKIHLATTCAEKRHDGRWVRTLVPEEKHQSTLASYAYLDQMPHFEECWQEQNTLNCYPRVLIDSGAFTAFTTGKIIKPQDYAQWALGFKKRWEGKMAFLRFMNLDVIGDQDASWRNQLILEKLGINPIPIVTYGADLKHLHRALDNYDYLALGGLVPYVGQKKKLQAWLDKCFSIIVPKFKKTGVMPKVHLLGVTTDWVLKRYPCYSSDSSSWVSCLRFGRGNAAGIKQLPRYKESDAALSATIHTLRAEIKKYQKMEQETTKLWNKRGIVFE